MYFQQSRLDEAINIVGSNAQGIPVGPPNKNEPLQPRENHDTANPAPLAAFGETIQRPLGDIALGRWGDKGGNVNIGLYVQTDEQWEWFRSLMTWAKMQELMGKDWTDWYFIEQCTLSSMGFWVEE